ncbi:metaxin-1-like [Amphibalanus amphitrite]|uniref:metaxin-1-like n=1 Tax=Amphibalanus amphitrite TaxID=1232801 RepID=UPI001C92B028|nr:metaxin-1-like [Amphibalanus amphitrite]XP_043236869.1 metaxin-1-like [Amphibalanus amphitrite]XP_043236870.1 metaxin-1-like [Amphibalanus amphitrite]
MNLEIWPGDWGLPSIDSNCLEVLTYLKMCGAEAELTAANNPLRSPSGHFPVLRHEQAVIGSLNDIILHLKRQNYNPDYALSARQCADSLAFTNLLRDRLEPALWLCWWVDAKNSTELTRKWYASHLRFPLNFYYPSVWEEAARRRLAAVCDFDATPEAVEAYVCRRADECFSSLSEQLGDRHWFLGGSAPTSLDARVFGLLAPLLRAPLPSHRLQGLLKGYPNLVTFVGRVQQKFFVKERDEYEAQQKDRRSGEGGGSRADNSADDAEFPHKRRNQVLAGLVAAVVMLTFALTNGIVKIETQDQSEYDMSEMDAD